MKLACDRFCQTYCLIVRETHFQNKSALATSSPQIINVALTTIKADTMFIFHYVVKRIETGENVC